jgi:hypothetical protein
MQSAAQRIVDAVGDLRRAIETTSHDRVIAGIVACEDWAAIFRVCGDDQRGYPQVKSYLRRDPISAWRGPDGVRGSTPDARRQRLTPERRPERRL